MTENEIKIILSKKLKDAETYEMLLAAQENKEILKVRIVGYMENPSGLRPIQKALAIGRFDDYTVFIPSDSLFLDNFNHIVDESGNPISDCIKEQMYKKCIETMIGSEISFSIYEHPNAIDPKGKSIIGIRVDNIWR